jgi:hypothetical protein
MRPLPIPHLHDWRKMEVCLSNLNKGKDDEGYLKSCNILKWSATVRKITEELLRKYSTLGQHKCESPITVLKSLYTLDGGPLYLSSLLVKPTLTAISQTIKTNIRLHTKNCKIYKKKNKKKKL